MDMAAKEHIFQLFVLTVSCVTFRTIFAADACQLVKKDCGVIGSWCPDCDPDYCLSFSISQLANNANAKCSIISSPENMQTCSTETTFYQFHFLGAIFEPEDCLEIFETLSPRLCNDLSNSESDEEVRTLFSTCGSSNEFIFRAVEPGFHITFKQKSKTGKKTDFNGIIKVGRGKYRKPSVSENPECSCPTGFVRYGCTCYSLLVNDGVGTWLDAESNCSSFGGCLVNIHSKDEMRTIKDFMRTVWWQDVYVNKSLPWTFIGLDDREQLGYFRWQDSSPAMYTEWFHPAYANSVPEVSGHEFTYQPSGDAAHLCAIAYFNYKNLAGSTNWFTIPCDQKLKNSARLCEVEAAGSPTVSPTQPAAPDRSPAQTICRDNWAMRNGKCYMMYTIVDSDQSEVVQLPDLENECQTINGTIASFESEDLCYDLMKTWKQIKHYGNSLMKVKSAWSVLTPFPSVYQYSDNEFRQLYYVSSEQHVVGNITYKEVPDYFPAIRNVICERATESAETACKDGQFQCGDGTCIWAVHMCNGVNECADKSDEKGCELTLRELMYACDSGEEIPESMYCDHKKDCNDNSDESRCNYVGCPSNDFACGDGFCIPMAQRCDLIEQCPDGRDEIGCNCTEFQCSNGKCIPNSHFRDLYNDCGDETSDDELLTAADIWRGYLVSKHQGESSTFSEINIDPYCTSPFESRCRLGHSKCFKRAEACIYDYGLHGEMLTCRDGSHLTDCKEYQCPGMFKCPGSYCVPLRKVCDGRQDCPHGEDEAGCSEVPSCPGAFHCHGQTFCVPQSEVCDGTVQCPFSRDDEMYCQVTLSCPIGCRCGQFQTVCDGAVLNSFVGIPPTTRTLMITNSTVDLGNQTFENLPYIYNLTITSSYSVPKIGPGSFPKRNNLRYLDLSQNNINDIPNDTFLPLSNLVYLNLEQNNLDNLNPSLNGLSHLKTLDLSNNVLTNLPPNMFNATTNLEVLILKGNDLRTIDNDTFVGLAKLSLLDIENNTNLTYLNDEVFQPLSLNTLKTDYYELCCVAGTHADRCTPGPGIYGIYNSCTDLIAIFPLRIIVWILAGLAAFGNIVVLILMCCVITKDRTVAFMIINLCLAGLLMAAYLFIIATYDYLYRGSYMDYDQAWRLSTAYQVAGYLCLMSCIMFVFTLFMIAIERIRAMSMRYSDMKISVCSAVFVFLFAWLIFCVAAAIPFILSRHFDINIWPVADGTFHVYYGSVATPLWFLGGLNIYNGVFISSIAFLLLLTLILFLAICCIRDKGDGYESQFARSLVVIFILNFICWIPIAVLQFLAMAGVFTLPIVGASWIALLVVPFNAAIDPYLYIIIWCCVRQKNVNKSHGYTLGDEETNDQKKFGAYFNPSSAAGRSKAPKGGKRMSGLENAGFHSEETIYNNASEPIYENVSEQKGSNDLQSSLPGDLMVTGKEKFGTVKGKVKSDTNFVNPVFVDNDGSLQMDPDQSSQVSVGLKCDVDGSNAGTSEQGKIGIESTSFPPSVSFTPVTDLKLQGSFPEEKVKGKIKKTKSNDNIPMVQAGIGSLDKRANLELRQKTVGIDDQPPVVDITDAVTVASIAMSVKDNEKPKKVKAKAQKEERSKRRKSKGKVPGIHKGISMIARGSNVDINDISALVAMNSIGTPEVLTVPGKAIVDSGLHIYGAIANSEMQEKSEFEIGDYITPQDAEHPSVQDMKEINHLNGDVIVDMEAKIPKDKPIVDVSVASPGISLPIEREDEIDVLAHDSSFTMPDVDLKAETGRQDLDSRGPTFISVSPSVSAEAGLKNKKEMNVKEPKQKIKSKCKKSKDTTTGVNINAGNPEENPKMALPSVHINTTVVPKSDTPLGYVACLTPIVDNIANALPSVTPDIGLDSRNEDIKANNIERTANSTLNPPVVDIPADTGESADLSARSLLPNLDEATQLPNVTAEIKPVINADVEAEQTEVQNVTVGTKPEVVADVQTKRLQLPNVTEDIKPGVVADVQTEPLQLPNATEGIKPVVVADVQTKPLQLPSVTEDTTPEVVADVQTEPLQLPNVTEDIKPGEVAGARTDPLQLPSFTEDIKHGEVADIQTEPLQLPSVTEDIQPGEVPDVQTEPLQLPSVTEDIKTGEVADVQTEPLQLQNLTEDTTPEVVAGVQTEPLQLPSVTEDTTPEVVADVQTEPLQFPNKTEDIKPEVVADVQTEPLQFPKTTEDIKPEVVADVQTKPLQLSSVTEDTKPAVVADVTEPLQLPNVTEDIKPGEVAGARTEPLQLPSVTEDIKPGEVADVQTEPLQLPNVTEDKDSEVGADVQTEPLQFPNVAKDTKPVLNVDLQPEPIKLPSADIKPEIDVVVEAGAEVDDEDDIPNVSHSDVSNPPSDVDVSSYTVNPIDDEVDSPSVSDSEVPDADIKVYVVKLSTTADLKLYTPLVDVAAETPVTVGATQPDEIATSQPSPTENPLEPLEPTESIVLDKEPTKDLEAELKVNQELPIENQPDELGITKVEASAQHDLPTENQPDEFETDLPNVPGGMLKRLKSLKHHGPTESFDLDTEPAVIPGVEGKAHHELTSEKQPDEFKAGTPNVSGGIARRLNSLKHHGPTVSFDLGEPVIIPEAKENVQHEPVVFDVTEVVDDSMTPFGLSGSLGVAAEPKGEDNPLKHNGPTLSFDLGEPVVIHVPEVKEDVEPVVFYDTEVVNDPKVPVGLSGSLDVAAEPKGVDNELIEAPQENHPDESHLPKAAPGGLEGHNPSDSTDANIDVGKPVVDVSLPDSLSEKENSSGTTNETPKPRNLPRRTRFDLVMSFPDSIGNESQVQPNIVGEVKEYKNIDSESSPDNELASVGATTNLPDEINTVSDSKDKPKPEKTTASLELSPLPLEQSEDAKRGDDIPPQEEDVKIVLNTPQSMTFQLPPPPVLETRASVGETVIHEPPQNQDAPELENELVEDDAIPETEFTNSHGPDKSSTSPEDLGRKFKLEMGHGVIPEEDPQNEFETKRPIASRGISLRLASLKRHGPTKDFNIDETPDAHKIEGNPHHQPPPEDHKNEFVPSLPNVSRGIAGRLNSLKHHGEAFKEEHEEHSQPEQGDDKSTANEDKEVPETLATLTNTTSVDEDDNHSESSNLSGAEGNYDF